MNVRNESKIVKTNGNLLYFCCTFTETLDVYLQGLKFYTWVYIFFEKIYFKNNFGNNYFVAKQNELEKKLLKGGKLFIPPFFKNGGGVNFHNIWLYIRLYMVLYTPGFKSKSALLSHVELS